MRERVEVTGVECALNRDIYWVLRQKGLLPPYRRVITPPDVDGLRFSGELNPCFNEDTEWP